MADISEKLLKEALSLPSHLRTLLIDKLLESLNIPIRKEDRLFVSQALLDLDRFMVINPCTSMRARNWRNWDPERYAAIADYAALKHHLCVVLTGGPAEEELAFGQKIISHCKTNPVNLIGQTSLKQLLALLDKALVLIAPDTGPAHMATAVGTPVIGLYATSNPLRTGPYKSQKWVINRYPEALEAEYGLTTDKAPWGKRVRHPEAMNRISKEDVKEMLDQIMKQIHQSQ